MALHSPLLAPLRRGFSFGASGRLCHSDIRRRVCGTRHGAVYASPRPGVEIERVEAAVRKEVARIVDDGVTEDELAIAKKRLQAEAVYARDQLDSGPRILGAALATGQTVEDVESWPERIEAVSLEQVNAAAKAVLASDKRSATGLLLPEPTS